MKKSFLTGLIILLPLALTLMIIDFILNFLTHPFLEATERAFHTLHIHHAWLDHPEIQAMFCKLLILLGLIGFTMFLGKLGQWFFIHSLIRMGDFVLHRIPLVRTVYKALQEVVNVIFSTDKKAFTRVVFVPFPSKETLCLGMITQESFLSSDGHERLTVFIPSTPHMTAGFLVMVKKEDLIHTEMQIEQAIKYVVSCGVLTS